MQFHLISIFPEMFSSLNAGITGRAIKNQLITVHHYNPRDYTQDKHRCIDDHPYGGGCGMVMMAEPLLAALNAAKDLAKPATKTIYLSPQGRQFDQSTAKEMTSYESVIFLAGRYEGIDERVIEHAIDEEWSIGDYILSGGEFAAMVMLDCITRLLPGVVGDHESVDQDSLTSGLLKYPQYTRPDRLLGISIPSVLLSGHHKNIHTWRLKQSLGKTWIKRPDLLAKKTLTGLETKLLNEFILEYNQK